MGLPRVRDGRRRGVVVNFHPLIQLWYTRCEVTDAVNATFDISAFPHGDDVPEAERLHREIARLQKDIEDLRASAGYWLRLYDAALRRANDLEARLVAGNDSTVTAPGRS